MTRYYASGARSHCSPHLFHTISAVRIYKDQKEKKGRIRDPFIYNY